MGSASHIRNRIACRVERRITPPVDRCASPSARRAPSPAPTRLRLRWRGFAQAHAASNATSPRTRRSVHDETCQLSPIADQRRTSTASAEVVKRPAYFWGRCQPGFDGSLPRALPALVVSGRERPEQQGRCPASSHSCRRDATQRPRLRHQPRCARCFGSPMSRKNGTEAIARDARHDSCREPA
jgi:hypothetical protein